MASQLTTDRAAGARLERPGAFTETSDSLATFNPDLANPLLAGRTNPETGKPFIGASARWQATRNRNAV